MAMKRTINSISTPVPGEMDAADSPSSRSWWSSRSSCLLHQRASTLAVGAMVKKNAAIKNDLPGAAADTQADDDSTYLKEMRRHFRRPGWMFRSRPFRPTADDVALGSGVKRSVQRRMRRWTTCHQTAAKDRILDDFGTPIVYVPANVVVNNTSTVVVQEGYFSGPPARTKSWATPTIYAARKRIKT